MKRITLIAIAAALVMGFHSCKNQEWEFPDFDFRGVYFPYQYPVRTLVLGDYQFDNENDNDLKFLISARIGGMYENKWDWTIDYAVDETYADSLITTLGDTIRVLPSAYYTLSPTDEITISKGSFYGSIEVQLTEAFLADTNAHRVSYVIPLKITGSNADTILSGSTTKAGADPRVAGDWAIRPRDFTLFGIKYVSPYHGKYLHRGQSIITGPNPDTIVYRQRFVEDNEIWALATAAENAVTVSGTLRKVPASPGPINLKLTFDDNNNCVVTSTSGFVVTGTGKFVTDGDTWGGKLRDVIHLTYVVNDGTDTHTCVDTLVIRDRDVRFEEFVPIVY